MKHLEYVRKMTMDRKFAKDIRVFGLRDWLEDLWDSTMRLYRGFCKKEEGKYMWANVAELVLTFLRNGVLYFYLIHKTLNEGLAASEFLLYFSAASGFADWITGILDKFGELNRHGLELSSLQEFLTWPEPFKFEDGMPLKYHSPQDAYEIRLENVSYRYPEAAKDTIKNMDLTIHPGEKLAIVGLNGAGKTTLVKLICGFLDPTQGRVLLNGEDIRQYNRRDYYAMFSAVFQDFSVMDVTVAQNVAQRIDDIDMPRVHECLAQAGLSEVIARLPHQEDTHIGRNVFEDGVELSGGQTQRLMLARALYKNAPIIVLDEPTAALDPIAENDIYMKYNEMTDGRTSVFISHRLASTRFCDRILFLENGAIAEEGSHEDLLVLNGKYTALFEIQKKYYSESNEAVAGACARIGRLHGTGAEPQYSESNEAVAGACARIGRLHGTGAEPQYSESNKAVAGAEEGGQADE